MGKFVLSALIIISVFLFIFLAAQTFFYSPLFTKLINRMKFPYDIKIRMKGRGFTLVTKTLYLDKMYIEYNSSNGKTRIKIELDSCKCKLNVLDLFKSKLIIENVEIAHIYWNHTYIDNDQSITENELPVTGEDESSSSSLIVKSFSIENGTVEVQKWNNLDRKIYFAENIHIKNGFFSFDKPLFGLLYGSNISGNLLENSIIPFSMRREQFNNIHESCFIMQHINLLDYVKKIPVISNIDVVNTDLDLFIKYSYSKYDEPINMEGTLSINKLNIDIPVIGKSFGVNIIDTFAKGTKFIENVISSLDGNERARAIHELPEINIPFKIKVDIEKYANLGVGDSYVMFFKDVVRAIRKEIMNKGIKHEIQGTIAQVEKGILLTWEIPLKIIESLL